MYFERETNKIIRIIAGIYGKDKSVRAFFRKTEKNNTLVPDDCSKRIFVKLSEIAENVRKVFSKYIRKGSCC